jgi:hypothetical protein
MPAIKSQFDNFIQSTSDWIHIKDLPSDNTLRFEQMCKNGTIGVYIVALKEDTQEIEKSGYLSEKVGYIGMSNNIVSRTNSIRATVVSKKNCVYHGLGTYIKNRLDTIPFEKYVVKYLYCSEENCLNFENAIHSAMRDKFNFTFAWREASGGKDGKLERLYNVLTQLDDGGKLEVYEYIHSLLPDILVRQYRAKLDAVEE